MGGQAYRMHFELDNEEDRFFISGVQNVERSRQTYEHQLRKRKVWIGVGVGVGSLALVALILGLGWGLSHRKLDYVCPRTYDASSADLVFYVVGDWGRSGNDNQRRTARLMADVSECMPPQFVISTGDNFYPSGLKSADDPQFAASFSRVYSAPGLQVPWYAVMGNHDYGDNADPALLRDGTCLAAPTSPQQCEGECCISPWWQVVSELATRDARWNATMGCVVTRRFSLGNGGGQDGGGQDGNRTLDIIFVDTVPLIYQYSTAAWSNFLHGYSSQDGDAIKAALQRQLNESYAGAIGAGAGRPPSTWRLVVGHHPVRSYGTHCTEPGAYDCEDMAFLRPWLQRYRVAAYINGHDHDQQLIKSPDDPVHYVVSGAGSDTRAGEFDSLEPQLRSRDALFLSDTQGFVAVVVAGNSMRVHFYTAEQSGPTYTRVIMLPSW